ncbi:GNAT family N-acetyltransferase [Listeria booriae]|uniref:GNAT family N-acetyltransferase n=1 Tax=Listeria booriae TaxID=1552123 RepID=UPI001624A36A|nr:GNAT family protein [Listeria booriae]MBC2194619.1 GNAT family N-acetyltransferase [Listeria booriae]
MDKEGRIRPIKREDVAVMHAWELDDEIAYLSGITRPRSLEAFKASYESYFVKMDNTLRLYSIILNERVIGRIELGLIDRENGTAAFGIVIGDRDCWGQGYGKQAILELLREAFDDLHLHKVYCEVYAFNERSIRMMQAMDFKQDGVLREHEYFRNEHHDLVVFSMLRSEFKTKLKEEITSA